MPHVFSIEEIHNHSERGVPKLLLLLYPANAETYLIAWTRYFATKTALPSLSKLIDLQSAVLH